VFLKNIPLDRGNGMNLEKLRNYAFPTIEHDLTFRDSILYALGLGYGMDPNNRAQLQFVYEDGQKAVPSMCCIMGYPGFWLREPALEVDWVKLLHGEHFYQVFAPLPVQGKLIAKHKVTGVDDKGPGRGATVNFQKELYDSAGTLLAKVEQTNFLRGDGGCGSFGTPARERPPLPDSPPHAIHEIKTTHQIALIYRLSGDYNPVHADPEVAKKAGFPEPWLAGMCSMGLATRACIEKFCNNDPDRIQSMFVRFKSVGFPGETMRYEFYKTDTGARFRVRSVERADVVILDRGEVLFR
jgi:acyl dehydratase